MLVALPTPALAATPPSLGQAAGFAVLSAAPAAGGAVTCTNGTITGGDVGSTGAAASVVQTTCSISGSIIAPVSAQVVADFNTAYAAYGPIPCDSTQTGTLAGVTLAPGVYCVDAVAKTGTLTLNGPSTGTWIFKVAAVPATTPPTGALTGTNFSVVMAGGGLPCNVNWQVAEAATMTTSNFVGTILAGAAITLTGGTFAGNALATAGVTITGTTLTGCPPPPPGVIAITKTPDAASVSAGTPIGFTVTLSNTGAGTANGVTLTDALPGGNVLTPVHWSIDGSSGNPAAFSISGADGSQALSLAGQPISLAAGASLSVHVTAPTSASNCAAYNNTASVTTSDAGSDSKPASETVVCASITVTKTHDAASVSAGTPIGFTVVVANTGAGTATGVTLTDALPGGNALSPVHWSIDASIGNPASFNISGADGSQALSLAGQPISMLAGASLTVHVTAPTTSTSCATYNNTASVTTNNDGSDSMPASETVVCASITVTKTHDAASVSAGTPIGFTVVVANTGAGTATGVTLSDPLPGGNLSTPVHWSIDASTGNPLAFSITGADGSQALSLAGQPISMLAGASLTVHVTAPTSASSCTTYNNTASVTTNNDGSDSMPASETVVCASITITKTADAPTVNAGDLIGFTVVVGNPGAGTANGVTVSDPLPAGSGAGLTWSIQGQSIPGLCSLSGSKPTQVLSCGPTTLASGVSFNVHITATTSTSECTLYDNTASVTTSNDGSNTSFATITCHPANVTITKTHDAASVSAGTPIGFTVTVSNTGAGTATGVTLTDALPGGNVLSPVHWSIDASIGNPLAFSISGADGSQALILAGQPISLLAGTSLSVHVTAPTTSTSCATYDNTATVTTGNDGGDTKSASEMVLCASITITKTADAPTVNSGDLIGFTIVVANPGAGTATRVTVTDPLPAGSGSGVTWSIQGQSIPGLCSLSGSKPTQVLSCGPTTLASGLSFNVHITATTSTGECTLYDNTASVTTTNDGSNTSFATITCNPANVNITKTADAPTVNAGDLVGFTVTVSNTGAGTATGVTLSDALPGGNVLTPVHWSIDGTIGNPLAFSITGADGSQALSLAGQPISMLAGTSLSVHVTAPTTAQSCATYNNTAGVTTSNDGSGPSSASETVLCANVTILKTADAATVNAGDSVGFTILVRNPGTGTANGVMVSDSLPAGPGSGLSWSISSQSNAGLCSINSPTAPQTLSCGPTTLASLASFSVHITATTSAGECTLYASTATATTTNDGGGSSQATITCNLAPDPVLPGLPNTSAPDISAGGPSPGTPETIPALAVAILAVIAGFGLLVLAVAGSRRNRVRFRRRHSTRQQRHHSARLAVCLLAIAFSLAPASLSVGELASQPVVALAPGTQLIGSKVVSVVPPPAPRVQIFHQAAGPIIPSRLRIPSIGVDSMVGAVGLRADGSMDVPDNLWSSSWLADGPRPGEAGNAVIAGHRGVASPALFSHLENVHPGDKIFISDGAGNTLIYVVTRVASLDLSNSTQVAVFENGPTSQLVLITCFGGYIASARTYDHRLVVFSKPVLPIT